MNPPSPGEMQRLVARLSDGMLTTEEAVRLNALLKADPIAQEQYLDHLLVHGLLEFELGGVVRGATRFCAPGRPATADDVGPPDWGRGKRRILGIVGITVVAASAAAWFLAFHDGKAGRTGPERQPLELADSGFERRMTTARAAATATWSGDDAEAVEAYHDVPPLEGRRMLRFRKSNVGGKRACELYQIVDLSKTPVDATSATVEASASFNAAQEASENRSGFAVSLFAYDFDPSSQPELDGLRWENALAFGGAQTQADADAGSWQQVTARLPLPADAKFIVVQIAATSPNFESETGDLKGRFADNVVLDLVRP